jgi:hypothetical protein
MVYDIAENHAVVVEGAGDTYIKGGFFRDTPDR